MKLVAKVTIALGAALVFFACMTDAARAADLSRPVTLVATFRLAGSIYEETVLVAAPLPGGLHVGFFLNRPTRVKLEALFPEHAPSRKVVNPLSLGGPMHPNTIFAVTRHAPPGAGATLPLMHGLVAIIDGEGIDHVIETTPNDARYFAGLVIWVLGEAHREVRNGAWNVLPANVENVFVTDPAGLWKDLSRGGPWLEARLDL